MKGLSDQLAHYSVIERQFISILNVLASQKSRRSYEILTGANQNFEGEGEFCYLRLQTIYHHQYVGEKYVHEFHLENYASTITNWEEKEKQLISEIDIWSDKLSEINIEIYINNGEIFLERHNEVPVPLNEWHKVMKKLEEDLGLSPY